MVFESSMKTREIRVQNCVISITLRGNCTWETVTHMFLLRSSSILLFLVEQVLCVNQLFMQYCLRSVGGVVISNCHHLNDSYDGHSSQHDKLARIIFFLSLIRLNKFPAAQSVSQFHLHRWIFS